MIRMVGLALCLAACTQQQPVTIDGSNAEAFARTIEVARRDLPVADRLEFDRASPPFRSGAMAS